MTRRSKKKAGQQGRSRNPGPFKFFSSGKRSGDSGPTTEAGGETREQPKPKLPLLSGGKDSGLAERFEEELHRS